MKIRTGVIPYGAPASGKSRVARALHQHTSRFVPFRRIKVGSGNTAEYDQCSVERIAELRSTGRVLWENSRYNAIYAIDRKSLESSLRLDRPTIQVGQLVAIKAIESVFPQTFVIVQLKCSGSVARSQLQSRPDTPNISDRHAVRGETELLTASHVSIDATTTSVEECVNQILQASAFMESVMFHSGRRSNL